MTTSTPVQKGSRASGKGLVKAVLSGDTLVLLGASKTGEVAPEKEIKLCGIVAPQFKAKSDEPWAWHCREFLRKKILGRPVTFQIVFHDSSGHDVCNVQFNGEDLGQTLITHGWADVLPSSEKKFPPETQMLLELKEKAVAEGRGIWNKTVPAESQVRAIEAVVDVQTFYEKSKNTPLSGVLDRVFSASTYRIDLFNAETDPLRHTLVTINLAGVECPRIPSQAEEGDLTDPIPLKKPEPFALEAKLFVENRLLHRDVQIIIQGTDKKALYGTVLFEKGNITQKLLEQGFGRFVKWTAALTSETEKLQKAEGEAKSRKAGLWENYNYKPIDEDSKTITDFQAKVIQVFNGDKFLTEYEKRYTLASVRTPKVGTRYDPGEPLGLEAKEYLRKLIVGKNVRIVIEYERDLISDSKVQEKEIFVSLYLAKQNVNLLVIEQGFGEAVVHRQQEERATNYAQLVEQEIKTKKAKLGRWADPSPTLKAVKDLTQVHRSLSARAETSESGDVLSETEEESKSSSPPQKSEARSYLDRLKQTKQHGVVEHLFSATRYKIYVESLNCYILFALSGVRSPQKNDHELFTPCADVALQFARSSILQQEITFSVIDIDRGDNFLGTLWINKSEDIASALLKSGLAFTFGHYASENQLALEQEAKAAKLNYWADYMVVDTPADEDADEFVLIEREDGVEKHEEKKIKEKKSREFPKETNVRVTEIVNAVTFYCHLTTDEMVKEIQERMGVFKLSEPSVSEVKIGRLYAGLFQNDGMWHRVRIERKIESKWHVFFIDYGNRDILGLEDLRELDSTLSQLPGTAYPCVLTALKAPSEASEHFERTGQALSDLTWDRVLTATLDYADHGIHYVTLRQTGTELTINQRLLQTGCVRISGRIPQQASWKAVREMAEKLKEFEAQAKEGRRGIWEYGDVSDEDDDDQGRVPSKAVKEQFEKIKRGKEKELLAKKNPEEAKPKEQGAIDKGSGKGKTKE